MNTIKCFFEKSIELLQTSLRTAINKEGTGETSVGENAVLDEGPFYHGTRADLQIGDLLTAGFRSNYKPEIIMNHIYFTALVNGAGLAACLAQGTGHERVYVVAPTGTFEHDPNVTDKKFPGNPTRSYRSQAPLKIIGEVTDWNRLSLEEV
jgi:Rifampin ADP-ribosyl transferase